MIVTYCYLEKEKDILKFHVNKSADFGEEQHPPTKPSTSTNQVLLSERRFAAYTRNLIII